jgi:3-oxoacid CoA-transferase subunit A
VPAGSIDPDDVHVPGIYVHRVIQLSAAEVADLPIEKTTVRPKPGA